jgi:probable F420-dependent oxidoreductase
LNIAHAAARTSRIKLGTNVFILPLRDPFSTAQAAATAQNLSNGRVVMGVGSGWLREEYEALRLDFDRRGSRLDEALEVMDKLWSGKPVEHQGEHFGFRMVQLGTVPSHRIQITFGGTSQAALRRAARRGDGWNGLDCPLQDSISYRERINALRAEAGRSERDFQFYVKPDRPIDVGMLRTYREAGFDDIVLPFWKRDKDGRAVSLDESLDHLQKLADIALVPEFGSR